jgi:imidazolonepropionase-like amidohydrolase
MNREIILTDHTVIARDGKITEIGPSANIKIPKGARVINARGKYMIPPLSDMHVHLEGDAWNIMFPAESKFTEKEINFEDILLLYVANGVTTINILSALPEHISLREQISKNQVLGPRLILSKMIDGAGKAWPPPISTWINNAEEAGKAVIDIHDKGYDRIKVYSFLDKASYDSIMATAKRLDMPVDGHVPYALSVEYVLSSGQKMIAHTEEIKKFAKTYDAEQVGHFASLIAKTNTWVTSSLILNRNLNALLRNPDFELTKPGTEYLHPMAKGVWNFIYENLYKPIPEKERVNLVNGYDHFQRPFTYEFYRKGGNLLTGTDALVPSTIPGISLHEELEEMVSIGFSPYEALRVSTTNTFEFLGELDRSGTLEKGKTASFILLEENPLEKISNTRTIYGVYLQNRWLSSEEIGKRLEKIRESNRELWDRKFK